MIPFCDFGVCKDSIVAASNLGGEATRYSMVGRIIPSLIASGVKRVLPVAVLS